MLLATKFVTFQFEEICKASLQYVHQSHIQGKMRFLFVVILFAMESAEAVDLYKMAFDGKDLFSGSPKAWKTYIHKFFSHFLSAKSFRQKPGSLSHTLREQVLYVVLFREAAQEQYANPVISLSDMNPSFLKKLVWYKKEDIQYSTLLAKSYNKAYMYQKHFLHNMVKMERPTGWLQLNTKRHRQTLTNFISRIVSYNWSLKLVPELTAKIFFEYILIPKIWGFFPFCQQAFLKISACRYRFCGFLSAITYYAYHSGTHIKTTAAARPSFELKVKAFYLVADHYVVKTNYIPKLSNTFNYWDLYLKDTKEAVRWGAIVVRKICFFTLHLGWGQLYRVFDGPGAKSAELKPTFNRRHTLYKVSTFQCYILETETIFCGSVYLEKRTFVVELHTFARMSLNSSTTFELPKPICLSGIANKSHFCALNLSSDDTSSRINLTIKITEFTGRDSFTCSQGGIETGEILGTSYEEIRTYCMSGAFIPMQNIFSRGSSLLVFMYWYSEYSNITIEAEASVTSCDAVHIDPCDFYMNCLAGFSMCQNYTQDKVSDNLLLSMEIGKGYHQQNLMWKLLDSSAQACTVIQISQSSFRTAKQHKLLKRMGMGLSVCFINLGSASTKDTKVQLECIDKWFSVT